MWRTAHSMARYLSKSSSLSLLSLIWCPEISPNPHQTWRTAFYPISWSVLDPQQCNICSLHFLNNLILLIIFYSSFFPYLDIQLIAGLAQLAELSEFGCGHFLSSFPVGDSVTRLKLGSKWLERYWSFNGPGLNGEVGHGGTGSVGGLSWGSDRSDIFDLILLRNTIVNYYTGLPAQELLTNGMQWQGCRFWLLYGEWGWRHKR